MVNTCPDCGREYIKRNDHTDTAAGWDYTYVHEIDTSGTVPEVTDHCRVSEDS